METQRPFNNIEEVKMKEGLQARFFEVEGRPDILIREMPRNYGLHNDVYGYVEHQKKDLETGEKIQPHLEMEKLNEEIGKHIPVVNYKIAVYEVEGKKVVGAMVDKIYGESLESFELTEDNAEVFDEFLSGYTQYLLEKWKDDKKFIFPDELMLDAFMYGHRVDREGGVVEDNKVFFTDIDPMYTNDKHTFMTTATYNYHKIEQKLKTYRKREQGPLDFTKSIEKLKRFKDFLMDALLEDKETESMYTDIGILKDQLLEVIGLLEKIEGKKEK